MITDYDDARVAVRCPFALKDTLKAAVPWKNRQWIGAKKSRVMDCAYADSVH